MSNKTRLLGALALAMTSLSACSVDRPIAPTQMKPGSASADVAKLTTDTPLFSQPSIINSVLEHGEGGGSTYIADDFVVPVGKVWTVKAISISGKTPATPRNSINLRIFGDRDGVPSLAINGSSNTTLVATDPATCCPEVTDYLRQLPDGGLALPEGRYWISLTWFVPSEEVFDFQPAAGTGFPAVASDDGATTWKPISGASGLAFAVFGNERSTQSITFPPIAPNPAAKGTTATLGATASSNLDVVYTSLTTTVCTINGAVVQYVAPGLCTVAADQPGNDDYAAADRQTQSVNVNDVSPQSITFQSAPPSPAYVGGSYTVSATGGGSGNPVVLTAAPSGVCSIVGNVVSLIAAGTCTISANQAGNAAYTAAQEVTQTVKIGYRFDGFSDPVKNGVVNVTKAGKTLPLKWRLTSASGTPITNLTTATITVADLKCTLGSSESLVEEITAGSSGLQNLGNGYYQLNWKIPGSYAKSCKILQLDLGEGNGVRTAQFEFTK